MRSNRLHRRTINYTNGLSSRSVAEGSACVLGATMQPMRVYRFYVYLLASRSKTLYVGVTNNLWHRVLQHREGTGSVFTAHYRVTRLVHVEEFQYVNQAIAREKELKD